jgi:hypothetical protein
MRPLSTRLLPACLSALLAAPALAGVPTRGTSIVPACLIVCPAGDVPFQVTVRDIANNNVPNSTVRLDFSACPYFHHCAPMPGVVVDEVKRTIAARTDSHGVVTFMLPMGGTCAGAVVAVSADFQPIGEPRMASPDYDGNLLPDALDEAAIQAAVGSGDPGADLDCNYRVDAADLAAFDQHRFHACPLVVPARPRSWGELKTIYR